MEHLLKVEATSNDFVLGTGTWAERLAHQPDLVAGLCHRRKGVGADGTLALFPEGSGRVRLVYRNADGSHARFCANGSRCAARVAVELLGLDNPLVVATEWLDVPATVHGSKVTLDLPAPQASPRDIPLTVDGRTWHGTLLFFGAPHYALQDIREVETLRHLDLERLGPRLGHHPDLGPEGANVTFLTIGPNDCADTRTWEKGVEAETLSCGSGLVAAVLTALQGTGRSRLDCRTGGGDQLIVEVLGEPPGCPSRLTGPTRLVAHLDPTPEILGEADSQQ